MERSVKLQALQSRVLRSATGLLLATLVLPTVAYADCQSPATPIICAGEEREAAENEPKPVSTLKAIVTAHHGRTYANPGYTSIKLLAEPEAAYMTFTTTKTIKWLTSETSNVVEQPWTCELPKESFNYVATARASVGATVTIHGYFRAMLSAHWCAAAKKREAQQQAHERHEDERLYAEEVAQHEREERRATEQQQQEQARWESNCRKLGGTVVQLPVGDAGAEAPFCRGQDGGIITVPS
jgi:hypothetical protein